MLVDGVRVADTASPGGRVRFRHPASRGHLQDRAAARLEQHDLGQPGDGRGARGRARSTTIECAASAEYGGPEAIYAQASAGTSWGPLIWRRRRRVLRQRGHFDRGRRQRTRRLAPVAGRRARVVAGGRQGLNLRARPRHLDARARPRRLSAHRPTRPSPTPTNTRTRAAPTPRPGSTGTARHIDLRATYSLSDTKRESFDPAFGADPRYTTHGRERAGGVARQVGHDRARSACTSVRNMSGAGWKRCSTPHAQQDDRSLCPGRFQAWPCSARTPGLRHRRSRPFRRPRGAFGADGAVALGDGWRVRGSYGEGFKAPTLFQLLSDYGNSALRPERSRGFDVGIEQGDRNTPLHIAASVFRRDSADLIDFISCFGRERRDLHRSPVRDVRQHRPRPRAGR